MIYSLHLWFFAYFAPGTIWATMSKVSSIFQPLKVFCEGKASNLSPIRFWKFSNCCTWIFGMPITWKIQDFSFWAVFNASEKVPGCFAIAEYVISRNTHSLFQGWNPPFLREPPLSGYPPFSEANLKTYPPHSDSHPNWCM